MKSTNNTVINKHLRIANWNSRGFSAAIPHVRKLFDSNDIIGISEHWLHRNQLYKLNEISKEFTCFGRASKMASEETFGIRRGLGGVAICWRSSLSGVTPLLNVNHDRICGIRMQTESNNILNILSVYMPSAGSPEDLNITLDELSGIVESFEDGAINIIIGDLNGDIGHLGGPRSVRIPTRAGQSVMDFINKYELTAINLQEYSTGSVDTFKCHNGSSTIDYVLIPSTWQNKVVTCHTEDEEVLNTSDHFSIQTTIDVGSLPSSINHSQQRKSIKWDKMSNADIYNLYEAPLALMLGELQDIRGDSVMQTDAIDSLFDRVISCVHLCTNNLPKSKFARHLKPFWSDELSAAKREKMHWFNLWKLEGRTINDNDPVRTRMKESKKSFRKLLSKISRRYDNELILEAARLAEVDRNQFWRLFKKMKGNSQSKVHAVKDSLDTVVYDIESILEVWRLHFSKLSTPRESPDYDHEHYQHVNAQINRWMGERDISEFLENPFTANEVSTAICKLHLKKTPGHDRVTAEHLKYGGQALWYILSVLFNICVSNEYIPANFRKGIQIPLYKGKNTCPLDPDNYRGITLLSSFNKLFEMLIWRRIEYWWENNRVISELQGACRKGSSCIHTALTTTRDNFPICLPGEKGLCCIF